MFPGLYYEIGKRARGYISFVVSNLSLELFLTKVACGFSFVVYTHMDSLHFYVRSSIQRLCSAAT